MEDDKQVSEHHRTYGGWRTTSRSVGTTYGGVEENIRGVEDDKQVSEHHRTYGGWRTTSRSV